MKFTNSLLKGKLQRRYKRFFTDIEVNNKTVVAHCPNTGSMMGLLDQGNEAWISEHNDPKRKLKFTLEMIKVKNRIIGVNTHRANRIVEHALENKLIKEFSTIKNIRAEFKYSDDTRFDFLCDKKILEVKNTTLMREDDIAEFPDAVTSRGTKHLQKLRESIKKGFVRRASFELGWVFGFEAKVVPGSGRGKGLGFPTANFQPIEKNQLIPANGVYFIRGRINSINLYGMCNLGTRPTFDEIDFVMEVHFFKGMVNDIYGKTITVEFLERVRDEKKFSSPKELIKQLEKDKEICMRLIQKYN